MNATGKGKGTGDPTDHSCSHSPTPETESQLSLADPSCGHRTIWRRQGTAGSGLPREDPEPKSRSTVKGQDHLPRPGSLLSVPPPLASPRGLRSQRRPRPTWVRRLQSWLQRAPCPTTARTHSVSPPRTLPEFWGPPSLPTSTPESDTGLGANKSSTCGGEAQVRRDPQRIHVEEQCPRQAESGPTHLPLMHSLEHPSKGRSLPTTITLPPWVTAGGGHVAKQTWLLPWPSKDHCV